MANYDFSTLNSSDLEELACDLLNDIQPLGSPVKYRTFKDGKDMGIDLLYSTPIRIYEHIGQVKHYYRTGIQKLLKELPVEAEKVKKLNPAKYLFLTSVDLNPGNVIAIKEIFQPYIKDVSDIYGKKDLNRLIEQNATILERHYKLWISDFTIIQSILNSTLQFRSTHMLEHELKKRLRIYVETPIFNEAAGALDRNKFVIITGDPGVGKTTLAEMLVYRYIAQGFRLSYVYDIKEAEQELIEDETKQIIYFDDFLGSTAVEINKAKGSEVRLMSLLRRIPKMQNKYIVFTTRTYLLNTASQQSERLRQFEIKTRASLFKLEEYDLDMKRKLYLNHLENSIFSDDLKDILVQDDVVNFIITHEHYNPRAVEYITSSSAIAAIAPEQLKEFIIKNLKILDEIWLHAYTEQITDEDRILLSTLISFGQGTSLVNLEKAFSYRMEYEVKYNNRTLGFNTFLKCLERLEDGFILIDSDHVQLLNPSLEDFLVKQLRTDKEEVNRIVLTVSFASQLTERLYSLANFTVRPMPDELQKRLVDNYSSFIEKNNYDYDLIQLAMVINRFVTLPDKYETIIEIINEITDYEMLREDYELNKHFQEFFSTVKHIKEVTDAIEERIMEIIDYTISGISDITEATNTLEELVEDFSVNLSKVDTTNIISHFEYLFSEHIATEIEWLYEFINYADEGHQKKEEIAALAERLQRLGLEFNPNLDDFDIDWEEAVIDNEIQRRMEEDD